MITTDSMESRYRASAHRFTEVTGVLFADLVEECCRSCIGPGSFGLAENEDFAYTYAGQSDRLVWECGILEIVNRRYEYDEYEEEDEGEEPFYEKTVGTADRIHVYYTKESLAHALVTVFREHGFIVEWDGNPFNAVVVTLQEN